jgi:hypothetical protein
MAAPLSIATAANVTAEDPDLVTLAKDKLGGSFVRTTELDRLTRLLRPGERVVTLCDALFRSGRQESRGLTVLTSERLICVDTYTRYLPLTELDLSAITSVAAGVPSGSGDARRGEVTMLSGSIETMLVRVRPWERAAEIAQHIRTAI